METPLATAGDPTARRMLRDVKVQDAPAIMTDDEEAVEHAERNRWHGEEIHRRNRFPMVSKEGQPALGPVRISRRSSHPTGDGSLGKFNTERTISRWMRRAPRDPDRSKRWLAFLRNHREAIAAMDFFTVPTITFGVLYCFFVIAHGRRRILHLNVTKHPTSLWVVQQLREAFPFESAPRFLIFDRDGKYGLEVPAAVRSLTITPIRTSFESPWQNGDAERWIGRD